MVRVAGNRDTTPGSCEPGGAAEPHRVFLCAEGELRLRIAGVGSLMKAPLREQGGCRPPGRLAPGREYQAPRLLR